MPAATRVTRSRKVSNVHPGDDHVKIPVLIENPASIEEPAPVEEPVLVEKPAPVKKPAPKAKPITAAKKATALKKSTAEKLAAAKQADMAAFESELAAAQKEVQSTAANPVVSTIRKVKKAGRPLNLEKAAIVEPEDTGAPEITLASLDTDKIMMDVDEAEEPFQEALVSFYLIKHNRDLRCLSSSFLVTVPLSMEASLMLNLMMNECPHLRQPKNSTRNPRLTRGKFWKLIQVFRSKQKSNRT